MPTQHNLEDSDNTALAETLVAIPMQVVEGADGLQHWPGVIETSGPNFTAIPAGRDIIVTCTLPAIDLKNSRRLNSVLKSNPVID